jgi:hypothetical protein
MAVRRLQGLDWPRHQGSLIELAEADIGVAIIPDSSPIRQTLKRTAVDGLDAPHGPSLWSCRARADRGGVCHHAYAARSRLATEQEGQRQVAAAISLRSEFLICRLFPGQKY